MGGTGMALRAVGPIPAGLVKAGDLAPLIAEVADTLGEVGLLYSYVTTERGVPPDERERKVLQAVHLRAASRHLANARAELDLLHVDLTGRRWEPA